MLSWIKEGKNSSTILHILSITFVSLAFLLALITNFGNEELSRIVDLLKNDGAKAYAIFGLVALIFLGAIIAFIFYGSLLIHFLARMVFRIPLSFKDFYQIMKVFYIFLAFFRRYCHVLSIPYFVQNKLAKTHLIWFIHLFFIYSNYFCGIRII
jgi:hypothetical protein